MRVDVTYVARGQLAVIAQLRGEPSERAKAAIARVIERRKLSR